MALILNIDTSTKTCSVAVGQNGEVLSVVEETSGNFIHSEKLNDFIQAALQKAAVSFADLQAVAVSEGPGSYTGLRIGVSTAKGLCYALDIPLLSISTLKSMSLLAKEQAKESYDLFIPMIDARRMEVFCAGFNENLKVVFETRAEIIESNAFAEFDGNACYFGDGAEKCEMKLADRKELHLIKGIAASAMGMLPLSEEKFRNNDFADLAYFEPFYLKDFVAGKPKKAQQ